MGAGSIHPSGAAEALLKVIAQEPDSVLRALATFQPKFGSERRRANSLVTDRLMADLPMVEEWWPRGSGYSCRLIIFLMSQRSSFP